MAKILDEIIPARTAKAYELRRGQSIRVIEVEGLQVADLNIYSSEDHAEHFSAAATRRLQGIYLSTGGELWSNPGRDRVMLRIIEDTVAHSPGRRGTHGHSMIFPRCTEFLYRLWGNTEGHPSCQDSLARSIASYGLTADDTHDSFTLFQKAGVDEDGRQFVEESDAKQGDYVEFLAEMDCIVNISACPADDSAGPTLATTNGGYPKPLGIHIYEHTG